MMYKRTDLTLSMFYASSADADGNKVATLTMEVIAAEVGAVQTSQLRCITDTSDNRKNMSTRIMGFKAGVEAGKCIDRILRETVKSSLRWPGTMAKYCEPLHSAHYPKESSSGAGQPCPGVRPEAADTRGPRLIAEYTAVRLRYILSRTACSLPETARSHAKAI